MHSYVIETVEELVPKKAAVKKFRDEKEFLFIRGKGKKILVLNSTAREIYVLCDGRTILEIVNVMHSKYFDIDRRKMTLDILRFLRSMERSELIVLE